MMNGQTPSIAGVVGVVPPEHDDEAVMVGAPIVGPPARAIAIEGDTHISQLVEHTIPIPQSHELLLPILEVVPLQLLACRIAVR
jgi:glucosamine 6-phosphate synthetase-like amidotransferase/phosphosugar isomerase protein